MHALVGEFLGTMTLIVFGDGVVANVVLRKTKGSGADWIVIATGWGLAVMVAVFVATATGSPDADINPAVTLAKWITGMHQDPAMIFAYIVAQIAGGFAGGVLVWLAYLPHFRATPEKELKLAVFCTDPGIRSPFGNVLCEIVSTAIFLLCLGGIASTQNISPGLLPFLVGGLVWAVGLSLGGPTGYAINPARDLGPRLAHAALPIHGKGGCDWGYAWVPVLGPIIGAGLGGLLWYGLILLP
ncbi:MIP/aquaporin family protein [Kushneria phosphatilytica]|uniref:Aquaporin family protein n=1 Tax=Kushneria phosphatilytica TaxID=657387 RepID=A0A1S1NXH8_9GAMM|nr:MIP/aquaporin family protein [Kushneria phosphatilytica]OHV12076.1 aquaporin [Kushneria phosphatilytica]QEL11269.1 aquaporin family protein [Kushneria phosphatilytica]